MLSDVWHALSLTHPIFGEIDCALYSGQSVSEWASARQVNELFSSEISMEQSKWPHKERYFMTANSIRSSETVSAATNYSSLTENRNRIEFLWMELHWGEYLHGNSAFCVRRSDIKNLIYVQAIKLFLYRQIYRLLRRYANKIIVICNKYYFYFLCSS